MKSHLLTRLAIFIFSFALLTWLYQGKDVLFGEQVKKSSPEHVVKEETELNPKSFERYRQSFANHWAFSDNVDAVKIPAPKTQAKPTLETKNENKKLVEIKAKIEPLKKRSLEATGRCDKAFDQIYPKSKWPAPYGPTYKNFADLDVLIDAGVNLIHAKEDAPLIRELGLLLSSGQLENKNEEIMQYLLRTFWETEGCRSRQHATLLDSSLELARKNTQSGHWKKEQKNELIKTLWQALVRAQQGYYTPNDLLYLVGFWQKVMAQKLADGRFKDELADLSDRMIHALHEEEARLPGSGKSPNLNALYDFYREVQELGLGLEQFSKELLESL